MKKSFTLIELLIVIAIIAILVGILLPVLNLARDKARSIKCISNIKQLSPILCMYSDDYDDWLVPFSFNDMGFSGFGAPQYYAILSGLGYVKQSYYYIRSVSTGKNTFFWCPDDNKRFRDVSGGTQDGVSYCLNALLTSYPGDNQRCLTKRRNIRAPGSTLYLSEVAYSTGNRNETQMVNPYLSLNFTGDANIAFRHAKSANMGYLDGHCTAEMFSNIPNKVLNPTNHQLSHFWGGYVRNNVNPAF